MPAETGPDRRKKKSPRRVFAWMVLLLALSGALGFFVARGDVELPAGIDLDKTLSSLRQTLAEVEERLRLPEVSEDSEKQALLARIADLETRIALDQALAAEPRLRGLDVRAEVSRDAVTLSGAVATADQKEAAEKIAGTLAEAREVTSRLVVVDAAAEGRSELARRVEFEIFATGAFDGAAIDVVAEGVVVTLRGIVRSLAERLLAVRLAEDVDGVSEVVDELETESALDERDPGERE